MLLFLSPRPFLCFVRRRVDADVYVFVDWRTRHALHFAWARARISGGKPKLLYPLLGPGQATNYARSHGLSLAEVGTELASPQYNMPCVLRLNLKPDPSIRVQWYRTNRHGIGVPVPEHIGKTDRAAVAGRVVKREGEQENKEYR